jgi:hypothetical protein
VHSTLRRKIYCDSVNSSHFVIILLSKKYKLLTKNNVHQHLQPLNNQRSHDSDKCEADMENGRSGDRPNGNGIVGHAATSTCSKRRNARHYDEYLEDGDEDDDSEEKSHRHFGSVKSGRNDHTRARSQDGVMEESHRRGHREYESYSDEDDDDDDDEGHDQDEYNEV